MREWDRHLSNSEASLDQRRLECLRFGLLRPLPYHLATLVMTTIFFLGCAMNPVTGRPDLVLLSEKDERQIGEEEAKKVEGSMGLTQDPQLAAYVEALGQRLAAQSPRTNVDYHFYVVEMVEPNAFALPGGFVYVSRGLLTLTNSEDELAGVMGHEIGHVAARHSVKRLSAAAPFAIVGGITGAVTGIVSDQLSSAVTGITSFAGGIVLSPYSRDQEREADTVGIDIAGRAGWDPAALSSFLYTLEREEELQQGAPRKPSFFDSHPATPERVEDTAKHAKKVTRGPGQPIAADHAAFLRKLDGLVVGPNPADGLLNDNRFVQPDLDFTFEFPGGWKTDNSRQAVVGAEVEGKALSLLRAAAEGNDPLDVPRAVEQSLKKRDPKASLMDKVQRIRIGDLPAARAVLQTRTKAGPTTIHLTWIAHKGLIYQLTGVTPVKEYSRYESTFATIAQSFRPLTASERSAVTVNRLRVISAREGETLAQVIERTNSTWSPESAAVANGLHTTSRLTAGQLLKLAITERYSPNR